MRGTVIAFAVLMPVGLMSGCKTASSAADGVKSAAQGVASTATSLVNVNLSNVLNDLSLDLKIDKANIPINAQIPITIAANVCGVSINILSVGAGGGSSQGCTATNSSPELAQAVQQQLAAGGNVGGGAQTSGTTSTAPAAQQPEAQTAPATADPGTSSRH
jgi:hypothetical protein